eukprot:TRINITY_DN270_c0_g2_i2.p1 TRINITY_DN270_c0_g2~~TRINITY_DN270_c0_g2_i2.p1  ORF type:complete len:1572 (+),score=354.00 TRINITY_DN270_c0_g2_i2:505-5220(+)
MCLPSISQHSSRTPPSKIPRTLPHTPPYLTRHVSSATPPSASAAAIAASISPSSSPSSFSLRKSTSLSLRGEAPMEGSVGGYSMFQYQNENEICEKLGTDTLCHLVNARCPNMYSPDLSASSATTESSYASTSSASELDEAESTMEDVYFTDAPLAETGQFAISGSGSTMSTSDASRMGTVSGSGGVSSLVSSDQEQRDNSYEVLRNLTQERDWNKDFQELLRLPDNHEKYTGIRHLAQDFQDVATLCSKVIINELNTDSSKKLIKAINIGGFAGGRKYITKNILFKFALDVELAAKNGWLYGGSRASDESAMKAAKNELRGLSYYSSVSSLLHFPLTVLVDYKGFRVIAEALLPINKDTIVYGSSDGGKVGTVHSSDPNLNMHMSDVGKSLNLLPHIVGGVEVVGPGDQEIHRGLDGLFYCIDLARVFPSESPSFDKVTGRAINPRSVFYKLLRPEFVLNYHEQLTSDGFCRIGRDDPQHKYNNSTLVRATNRLHTEIIPKFARTLNEKKDFCMYCNKHNGRGNSNTVLTDMHRVGINTRHIGMLRTIVDNELIKSYLLTEAFSRVVKNIIKEKMRLSLRTTSSLAEDKIKEIISEHFNRIMDHEDDEFWDGVTKRLLESFPQILTAKEKKELKNWRGLIDLNHTFRRLPELLGVTLTEECKTAFIQDINGFNFVYCDIESVNVRVTRLTVVDEAEGTSLFYKAMDCSLRERGRLMKMAESHFRVSCDFLMHNSFAEYMRGRSLYELSKTFAAGETKLGSLKLAVEHLVRCQTAASTNFSRAHRKSSHYLGKANLALAQCYLNAKDLKLAGAALTRAAFAFEKAVSLNIDSVPDVYRIAEKLFLASGELKMDTKEVVIDGVIVFCEKLVSHALILKGLPSLSSFPDHEARASIPKQITVLKTLLLYARALNRKRAIFVEKEKALQTNFVSADQVMMGVQLQRYRNQIIDKYQLALGQRWESYAQQAALRLICEHLPQMVALALRSRKLCANLEQWCVKATAMYLSPTEVTDTMFTELAPLFENVSVVDCANYRGLRPDLIASSLSHLPRLTSLDLSGCSTLNDSHLELIAENAPNLTHLSLSRCSGLTRTGMATLLSSLSHSLVSVALSGSHDYSFPGGEGGTSGGNVVSALSASGGVDDDVVSGVDSSDVESPRAVKRAASVVRGGPPLSDDFLKSLSMEMKNLKELNLNFSRYEFKGSGLDYLCNATFSHQLTSLHLRGWYEFNDEHAALLAESFSSLTSFSLSSKTLSNKGLATLAGASFIPRLKSVTLQGISADSATFALLLGSFRVLTEARFIGCFGIDDRALLHASFDDSLTSLSLASCKDVTGSAFLQLGNLTRSLRSLDLSFTRVNPLHTIGFISSQHLLSYLNVSHSSLGTDKILEEILPQLHWLRTLIMEGLHLITGSLFRSKFPFAKILHTLSLCDCKQLNATAIKRLYFFENLESLDLTHCHNVPASSVTALKKNLHFLTNVYHRVIRQPPLSPSSTTPPTTPSPSSPAPLFPASPVSPSSPRLSRPQFTSAHNSSPSSSPCPVPLPYSSRLPPSPTANGSPSKLSPAHTVTSMSRNA